MALPTSPASASYDRAKEEAFRRDTRTEVARCQKKNEEYEPARLVMKDTVTGARYLVTVASGVWTLTAL